MTEFFDLLGCDLVKGDGLLPLDAGQFNQQGFPFCLELLHPGANRFITGRERAEFNCFQQTFLPLLDLGQGFLCLFGLGLLAGLLGVSW